MNTTLATRLCLVFAIAGCGSAAAQQPVVNLAEPWFAQYTDSDATGQHVIALWPFDGDDALADASGNGHQLTLQDGAIVADGRFGGCLESFAGWPVTDQRHRAIAARADGLSPPGAFTLELWVRPKAALNADYPDAFLLDKKYVSDDDYQLILGPANRGGTRTLRACLGLGDRSVTFHSDPLALSPDRWTHLAFTYDAEGTGRFYVDGRSWGGGESPGSGPIRAGRHFLSIGDRIGSLYHGFPGFIDQVRISSGVREFRRVRCDRLSDRSVFVRMEPHAAMRLRVVNLQRQPLVDATATVSVDGLAERTYPLPELAAGASADLEFPLDTSLRPDPYELIVRLDLAAADAESIQERLPIRIVPRRPPHQFPVVMWGGYGAAGKEIERLRRIGFTHVLGPGADYGAIWEAGEPTLAAAADKVAETKQLLDRALASDLTIAANLSPGAALRDRRELQRVDRSGQPYTSRPDVCGLFPEVQQYCYNVGASMARTYGHFPAYGAALIHTEVRDHAQPCFHTHDRQAYRDQTGQEIPDAVANRRGVDYTQLRDFPPSRVIPDDHPLLAYYRWYWKSGDGWNRMNSRLVEGLRLHGREDFWTWHDPAVRVASVYGSGGGVDVLSQWTYSYPDPIRIGVATDELLAMAAGAPGQQQVMKMTQVIWYRSQTAPERKADEPDRPYQASWEREQPDAPFITIAPLHLREAFWTKIARPIRGIMYHGWQSLVPTDAPASYRYTHPQTQHELSRLIREVVQPLGPTLLQVPAARSDVALLESFAAEMFARRGTYGWGGSWAGDCHLVLQYAHLQPEIVFDETLTAPAGDAAAAAGDENVPAPAPAEPNGGEESRAREPLDHYRVLVMPDCDVLTESVVQRIRAFQNRGGIVIGDERTCPAIEPDYRIPVATRTGRADVDKQALLDRAAALRDWLDQRYQRVVDCSHSEVIPYRRSRGTTDYLFVVNDRREFGNYVGQHGIVMENGLPAAGRLSVRRPAGHAYDLLAGQLQATDQEQGQLGFDTQLGPCEGRVYMITDRAIDAVQIDVPDTVGSGRQAACCVRVVDDAGRPLDAVVPLDVRIQDPAGRQAEFSGFYGAADGQCTISLDIPGNTPPGTWQVRVRELASGRTATAHFRVPASTPRPPKPEPVDQEIANPEQPRG
jgi:hypothetical protein